jgi:protein-S-isoprenylcysteine O-methyltransferase Ste14
LWFFPPFSFTDYYVVALYLMALVAPLVFATLFFITAPYGRHERLGWGPVIESRLGWMIMESPASLIMLAMFFLVPANLTVYLLLVIWQLHYFHRAFLYPFSLRSGSMPVAVVAMAVLFNGFNGTLNGLHFVRHADWYDTSWLASPAFIAGLLVFAGGFYITKRSDAILRQLREDSDNGSTESRYKVPQGFLYRWIACPNYFGECVQWFGWFLMTLSPAGLLFFIWTLANLVPRAISHRRWYRETFPDFPASRRAIVPFIL